MDKCTHRLLVEYSQISFTTMFELTLSRNSPTNTTITGPDGQPLYIISTPRRWGKRTTTISHPTAVNLKLIQRMRQRVKLKTICSQTSWLGSIGTLSKAQSSSIMGESNFNRLPPSWFSFNLEDVSACSYCSMSPPNHVFQTDRGNSTARTTANSFGRWGSADAMCDSVSGCRVGRCG